MKSTFWALLLTGVGIVSVASAGHWGRAANYGTHDGYGHAGHYGGYNCGGGGYPGHCGGWNGHHRGGWGHGHCGGVGDCGGWRHHGHHGNDCGGYDNDFDDDCDD